MLLKPYNQINTETLDAYAQTYRGEVIENNDPDKLKRIKVYIPLWDMYTDDQLQWVVPEGAGASSSNVDNCNIPEIGSTVEVFFNNNNPEDPRYRGAGVTTDTKCSLYDEDYPNTYGEKDSVGNFTMHNKKTGISVFHHNSGTEVQMDPDGSFIVSGKTGAYIACDASGNMKASGTTFTVIADEDINISATRVNISASNLLNLKADFIELNGKSKIENIAPYFSVDGASCSLKSKGVNVVNSFSIDSSPSWTFFDPFSKAIVDYSKGILVSKVYA